MVTGIVVFFLFCVEAHISFFSFFFSFVHVFSSLLFLFLLLLFSLSFLFLCFFLFVFFLFLSFLLSVFFPFLFLPFCSLCFPLSSLFVPHYPLVFIRGRRRGSYPTPVKSWRRSRVVEATSMHLPQSCSHGLSPLPLLSWWEAMRGCGWWHEGERGRGRRCKGGEEGFSSLAFTHPGKENSK